MELVQELIFGAFTFGRNVVGIIIRPYETYRRIADKGRLSEIVYIVFFLALYFASASIVKTAQFRPFLLTKHFVLLSSGTATSFVVVVGILWIATHIVGGKTAFKKLVIAWGYTLLPTLIWFFSVSLLYVILPPPRTTAPQGIAFSILFLVFSAALFFWKIILSYLAIRFSARLDLPKILISVLLASPVIVLYSIWMYKLGIFKVPFI